MKWKILTQPLGMSVSNGYTAKKEIPFAIPLAMAAGSVFSSIFGGAKSAAANREAQRQLAAEKARTEAERTRAKYQSWIDTASGQNTIRMLNDQAKRAYQQIRGAAAVGGATDAAVAAEKEAQNLKQAEVIAEANAAHEDRKEQIDAGYRQQLSGLNQQQIGLEQQQAENISQAASGVSSGLMQGALATFGGTKLGQSLMGAGSPGGGGVTTPPDDLYKTAYENLKAANSIDWMRKNIIFRPRL